MKLLTIPFICNCKIRTKREKDLFMVILTALLSAAKARRSDIISAVAPPNFCFGITLKLMQSREMIYLTCCTNSHTIRDLSHSRTVDSASLWIRKRCWLEGTKQTMSFKLILLCRFRHLVKSFKDCCYVLHTWSNLLNNTQSIVCWESRKPRATTS